MSALKISELTIVRNGTPVLRDLSIEVTSGSWLGVVGPNGAGKSSLLLAIAGLLDCRGSVTIDGLAIRRMKPRERARIVALMPQRPVLPPNLSVRDYVLLGRTSHLPTFGLESAADREAVDAILERLDLSWLQARSIDSLSGGEVQRAVLARSVAQEPTVLLLDEPTAALDIAHQVQALELVDELRIERGLTVVSAIHDLTLAASFSDQLLMLACGEQVGFGRPADVMTAEAVRRTFGAEVDVLAGPSGPVVVPRRTVRL